MARPFEDFDWNLRSCGRHGHVTYRPTEEALAHRLTATTEAGEAWRCLRCGDFVLGAPHGSGPAADAPLVLRGPALRDAFILRLLAVERFVRGLLLLALAYGIYRFNGARDSLQQVFDRYLPAFRTAADRVGIDLQNTGPVRLIQHALALRHSTLMLVAAAVLAYAALQLGEGTGLWLMKRWGEYLAVVGTGIFVPLEVYEILERVTWLRVAALLVNVFAVVYILYTKRLFGLRGGRAAFEAERHSASLLEVESAALEPTGPSVAMPG
ncbi:DUF2127 domain-containing protein [Nocardioides mangrovicus]|uniref:DUF2127 domain-containing protein n=1 Tax=Nocardioides mangrovicus TaxID=2478913 RepID=A0A3L8P6S5_9ACTN|nr:DUF2127 domain-containing protein [Nocardioides mangrovicus]RLV50677.1 DUF2127 domain-containing protein [Nocardioides mangrovicus]